jgi:RNA polymerase sigma-70 factor (ECF subfamily)
VKIFCSPICAIPGAPLYSRLGVLNVTAIAANRLARICAYSTKAPEWGEFVRLVTPVVALTARRVSLLWSDESGATVSEIVQEVFLKLCEDDRRILREFEDRGSDSFFKLIRMITASVATDHFRRTRAEKRGGRIGAIPLESTLIEEELSDGESVRAVEWPTLMAQLDGLLRLYPDTVSMRDRNLFWMYYMHGMTAEAIARIPAMDLGAKGVESALLRLVRLLRLTIANGKPKTELAENENPGNEKRGSYKHETELPPHELSAKKLLSIAARKGFTPVVAIDSVEHQ